MACHRYDVIQKILERLKPADTPEQPVQRQHGDENLLVVLASGAVAAIACLITVIVMPELLSGAAAGLSPEIVLAPACAVVGTIVTVGATLISYKAGGQYQINRIKI